MSIKVFNEDEFYDHIECPICGKWVQRLKAHVAKSHKIDWNTFTKEYPNFPHISGKELQRRQEIMNQNNSDPEFQAKVRYANAHPTDKKLRASINTLNKINANRDPEWNKQASIRMTNYNKSDKHKEVVRNMMLKRHEDPNYTNSLAAHGRIGNRIKLTLPNGRSITTRSSVEASVIEELSKITTDFDYECVSIKYMYNGFKHNYIPDLLVNDSIIIEVKPPCYWEDEINQAKKKACEAEGYKFYFVFSADDLYKIFK